MKLKECNFKLNIKSCMLFEMLSKKSFFQCETEEDISKLMYASFVINNDIRITYKGFLNLLEEKELVERFTYEFQFINKFLEQITELQNIVKEATGESSIMKITDVAMDLIVKHKIDPHYIFYEMELWEIIPFLNNIENNYKEDMAEKRMWAYINVMPHIDHKKCKSPEKLLPFPWENKIKKENAEKELEKNTVASQSVLGMDINFEAFNKEEKENG